jgi:hypothetical protein
LRHCPVTDLGRSHLPTLDPDQRRRAVKVSASVLTTDPFEEGCQVLPNVNTLTRNAAVTAYEQAGVSPADLILVELHDCFATAELVPRLRLRDPHPGKAARPLTRLRRGCPTVQGSMHDLRGIDVLAGNHE